MHLKYVSHNYHPSPPHHHHTHKVKLFPSLGWHILLEESKELVGVVGGFDPIQKYGLWDRTPNHPYKKQAKCLPPEVFLLAKHCFKALVLEKQNYN